jgi:hypothetical protein
MKTTHPRENFVYHNPTASKSVKLQADASISGAKQTAVFLPRSRPPTRLSPE